MEHDYETEADFEFGIPATDSELAEFETRIAANIPPDLRNLLREFNGIKRISGEDNDKETFFFSTSEMPYALEMYRNWDQPTELLMDCSRDILYVCQENGYSNMWGLVIRPFASFVYGQVVAFDHDLIRIANNPGELFASPYSQLIDLVEAEWKKTS